MNETVKTAIWFNCGCGFRSDEMEAAEQHASETGHTVHGSGEIRSTTPKPQPTVRWEDRQWAKS